MIVVFAIGLGMSKVASQNDTLRFVASDHAIVVPDEVVPERVLHQAPFTSQAPDADWNPFYEEMCEEASMLIAWRYYLGDENAYLSKQDANSWLNEIAVWERANLGTDVSTPIYDAYLTLIGHFALPTDKVTVLSLKEVDDLTIALSKGAIVAPFAGRLLGNPNYSGDGPRYHMMTILGYEGDEFIVHDVGTRKGAYYRYKKLVLWDALHDFVPDPADIITGQKQAILIQK